jgi:large subunit ribosomal protein L5
MMESGVSEAPSGPYKSPLEVKYRKEVVPALMRRFGYRNPWQAPRLTKIVVNMGVGEAIQEPKVLDSAMSELALITGQKPAVTRAKRSVAGFKLREGMAIGCRVTLRGSRLYDFLGRLVNVAIPRIRDFRGLPDDSFDGRGNYSMGVSEQVIFPEVDYDKIDRLRGMDITLVTTAKTDEECFELLKHLGMPFRRR